MRVAVITGASSGLGREFARQIDQTELDIDEIWLIARRADRLKETAAGLDHAARCIPLDLTAPESVHSLEELLENTVQVGVFVNCAGGAKIGNYAKMSAEDADNMIDLNCKAAVHTTLAVLPHMKAGDRIIELCSTAAFQPLQHMNLYAASKAFLYSYTRALRMELLPRGILVTAVCPWWVKDTEFIGTARDNAANPDIDKAVRGFPLSTKSRRVVRLALRDSRIGLAVSTPGIMCFLHRLLGKVIPRTWLLWFWEFFRRIGTRPAAPDN